ncbi:MAG: tetratricopeptide repeat protein [Vicinamibacterales bacterium]
MRAIATLALLIVSAGCSVRRQPVQMPSALVPAIAREMAAADALVRDGCYDCLTEALAEYRRLAVAHESAAAEAGARRTAGLLAIRERELGLVEQGHLAAALDGANAGDSLLWDAIATLPRRSVGVRRLGSEADLEAMRTAKENQETWTAQLAEERDQHALAAVTALVFACTYPVPRVGPDRPTDRVTRFDDTPLVLFTTATCPPIDDRALSALLEADPRFAEIEYFLGVAATLNGDLEAADRNLQRALAWRRDWPAAMFAVANVAMTAEDFDRAAAFYEETLTLVPGNPDAELGRVRALSYGGKYVAALDGADRLLAGNWHTGNAYYWRAWNAAQLNQNEEAWADIEKAATLIFNAEVPKLTGMLATRRGDYGRAHEEFILARTRNPDDCETAVLLGGVHLDLRSWSDAASVLTDALGCLDRHDEDLRAAIARLLAMSGRGLVAAHREQQLLINGRLRAQSSFNLAVAAVNLGDVETARLHAARVTGDERFADRALLLLQQLK